MPASELVAKLSAAMTAQDSQLRSARNTRAEQNASRSLREEQDSAYERSLAADRERVRRRREEAEAQARAEREAAAAAETAEKKQRKVRQWRRWRAQSLPAEPGGDVKDVSRVSIRMPSGERIIRKFRSDADLEELYAFVDCHGVLQQHEDDNGEREKEVEEPDDYEHKFEFRLVSPMPRQVFEIGDGGSVGERMGRSGNLIVEAIDEEEQEGS